MYPFYNVQPLFPFWGPFLFGRRRRRLNTISGIPVLKTTGVVATSTEVRYDVNYQEYRSLPNEGLFFLDVRQSSAEASASLPVGLSDGNSENNNQSMLRNALQEKENDEIIALQKEVNELKNIIRKANQMVPPPMKEMLPQDMKNAMDKVGQ